MYVCMYVCKYGWMDAGNIFDQEDLAWIKADWRRIHHVFYQYVSYSLPLFPTSLIDFEIIFLLFLDHIVNQNIRDLLFWDRIYRVPI